MSPNTTKQSRVPIRSTSVLLVVLTAFASLSITPKASAEPFTNPFGGKPAQSAFEPVPWWVAQYGWPDFSNKKPVIGPFGIMCVNNNFILVDVTDPDDIDYNLHVELTVHRGTSATRLKMAPFAQVEGRQRFLAGGIYQNPELVDRLSVRARDPQGAWSETTTEEYDHTQPHPC